jgi:hypothetical protein
VSVSDNLVHSGSEDKNCINKYKGIELTSGMSNRITVIYWNCHGLSNMFNADSEQTKIFSSYSIIGLYESWHNSTLSSIAHFENYKLISKEGIRTSGYGRASGGMIMLIKNDLKSAIIEANEFYMFVKVENEYFELIVGLAYFRPDSVREGIESLKHFFERHENTMNSHPVIVGGDFNSRIGNVSQSFDTAI